MDKWEFGFGVVLFLVFVVYPTLFMMFVEGRF